MTATQPETILCRRCKGTGLVSSPVLHAGVSGGCFACDTKGRVYKDPFYRKVGAGKTFYRVTYKTYYGAGNPNNAVYLKLSTGPLADMDLGTRLRDDGLIATQSTADEITEAEARSLLKTYRDGVFTGIRLADFNGKA